MKSSLKSGYSYRNKVFLGHIGMYFGKGVYDKIWKIIDVYLVSMGMLILKSLMKSSYRMNAGPSGRYHG